MTKFVEILSKLTYKFRKILRKILENFKKNLIKFKEKFGFSPIKYPFSRRSRKVIIISSSSVRFEELNKF